MEQNLEEENENLINVLSSRVREIKDLAHRIHSSVAQGNRAIGIANIDYGKAGEGMNFSLSKLNHLLKDKTSIVSCYLILFILLIFFTLLMIN